jgi:hypothetical protein
LELCDELKFLSENPLALDADNLSSIINKHAETVCIRTLASRGVKWGTDVLKESISAHEKLIKNIGREPNSAAEIIQIAISRAMITRARTAILRFTPH